MISFFGRKGFDYYFSCEWGRLDGGLGKRKTGAGLYSIIITLLVLDIGHYF